MFTKGMFFFFEPLLVLKTTRKKNYSFFNTLEITVKNVKRSQWRRDFIL